jgi:hypothetical protein
MWGFAILSLIIKRSFEAPTIGRHDTAESCRNSQSRPISLSGKISHESGSHSNAISFENSQAALESKASFLAQSTPVFCTDKEYAIIIL